MHSPFDGLCKAVKAVTPDRVLYLTLQHCRHTETPHGSAPGYELRVMDVAATLSWTAYFSFDALQAWCIEKGGKSFTQPEMDNVLADCLASSHHLVFHFKRGSADESQLCLEMWLDLDTAPPQPVPPPDDQDSQAATNLLCLRLPPEGSMPAQQHQAFLETSIAMLDLLLMQNSQLQEQGILLSSKLTMLDGHHAEVQREYEKAVQCVRAEAGAGPALKHHKASQQQAAAAAAAAYSSMGSGGRSSRSGGMPQLQQQPTQAPLMPSTLQPTLQPLMSQSQDPEPLSQQLPPLTQQPVGSQMPLTIAATLGGSFSQLEPPQLTGKGSGGAAALGSTAAAAAAGSGGGSGRGSGGSAGSGKALSGGQFGPGSKRALARNASQILSKHEQLSSRWEALRHLLSLPSLQSFEQARTLCSFASKQQQQQMGSAMERQASGTQQQQQQQQQLPPPEAAGTAVRQLGSSTPAGLPHAVVNVADAAAAVADRGDTAAAGARVGDAAEDNEDEDVDVEAPLVKKSKKEVTQLSRFKLGARARR